MSNDTKTLVNTVCLSKDAYDKIKGENIRCKMLLDSLWNSLKFVSEDSDELTVDAFKVTSMLELCYPSSFKEKRSYLKSRRTKERMKAMEENN